MTDGSLFDVSALDAPAASQAGSTPPQSLYRKYRPRSFAEDDLFGQEHVVNTLRNAIALDRIAHAYLFCGPRGTGKTTTARLIAKAVNCLDPDALKRPCNACDACNAINRNATTDVIEIDAASNRGIDDIRDLRERVNYAPTQLATKFYIIDEAHQITGAAANAFLKTLEEPPAHTRFVLATTDPEELLPTIVSRCQRFDFRRINLDAMVACLRKVATLEGIDVEPDALPLIARHATGSLRDALGILDQVAVYREDATTEEGTVTVDTVRAVLGISRNERVEELVRALADRDVASGLRAINGAVEDGDDIRQLGRELLAYVRILMLHRAGGPSEADERGRALAERFSLPELASLARLFSDLDVKVKHATFPQLPLEIAVVNASARTGEVARPPDVPTSPVDLARPTADPMPEVSAPVVPAPRGSLRDRVRGTAARPEAPARRNVAEDVPSPPHERAPEEHGESQPGTSLPAHSASGTSAAVSSPAPDRQPAPVSEADATGSSLTLETIVELWSRIRADVKAINRRVEALLQQIDPAQVMGDKIFLVSPYEFHRNRLNSDDTRTVVEDVISRLVKHRVQVTCVSREEAVTMATGHRSNGPSPDANAAISVESVAPTSNGVEAVPATAPVEAAPDTEGPSTVSSPEDDEQRITAAKNIFDAEEFDD